jgi:hypothetical protein
MEAKLEKLNTKDQKTSSSSSPSSSSSTTTNKTEAPDQIFQKLVTSTTQEFQNISRDVRAIMEQLTSLKRADLSNILKEIQLLEKEKLEKVRLLFLCFISSSLFGSLVSLSPVRRSSRKCLFGNFKEKKIFFKTKSFEQLSEISVCSWWM